jgi:hypothetical protein
MIHSYIGAVVDEGRSVKAIDENLAGLASQSTDRRAAWIEDTYNSHDWIERRYTGPDSKNILLFVASSFDLKRLYHHPEIGVLHGVDLKRDNDESLQMMSDVPVHVLRGSTGTGLAGYVLFYDGQFIRNPIEIQVLSSIELMFSPRKSMTLFLVYDSNADSEDRIEQSAAGRVLESAIDSFLAQKSGSSD